MADDDTKEELSEPTETGQEGEDKTESKEAQKKEKKKQTAQERIDEIYGKYKEEERNRQELEGKFTQLSQNFETLKQHNEALSASMGILEEKVADDKRPDPIADPEAYDEWILEKLERKQKKSSKEKPEKTGATLTPASGNLQVQEAIEARLHDDYWEVIEKVKGDMDRDLVLRSTIMTDPNPPKKAYEYWQKKMEKEKGETEKHKAQGYVEGATHGEETSTKGELNEEQKFVADQLGISYEKYAKQLEHIEKSRGVRAR
ncbi:MAG: hypothetical protein Q6356_005900 [Candidatus Wukongarchaeota archaeon]|nr:hypothetical protein [Candidatus Wukongarchaeota archaeon]